VNDVLYIISRTAIRDSSQLDEVVDAYLYRPDYLYGLDRGKCLVVAEDLYLNNKIIQPRVVFGFEPSHVPNNLIWMDLTPTVIDGKGQSEQVKKTWRDYQLALKMSTNDELRNARDTWDRLNEYN
jgi:hypothetical protein